MTVTEWQVCTDPIAMLKFFRDLAPKRKLRLFACGCCREMWGKQPHELGQRAIQYGEDWVETGKFDGVEGQAIWDEIMQVHSQFTESGENLTGLKLLYGLTCLGEDPLFLFAGLRDASMWGRVVALPRWILGFFSGQQPTHGDHHLPELKKHWLPVVRCIFGNPYFPVPFDRNWHSSTAIALAKQMYASRDFAAMPILADALQDAGCENADILDHCRGPGPHVRGCWVVDLVLGKE